MGVFVYPKSFYAGLKLDIMMKVEQHSHQESDLKEKDTCLTLKLYLLSTLIISQVKTTSPQTGDCLI